MYQFQIDEPERQGILLAMARLAVERPGWDWVLGQLADKLSGREMFDQFKELREGELEGGGAYHRIDDETGMPFWELWGEGWKDSEKMDVGKALELLPIAFPPGTRVTVTEPALDDPRTKDFYAAQPDPKDFYPCDVEKYDR